MGPEPPCGLLKQLEDLKRASLVELARHSGVQLPDAVALQSLALDGFASDLDMYVTPTVLGLREAARTCGVGNARVTHHVVDMCNFLSNSPRQGFVVLTAEQVVSLDRGPDNIEFPPEYRRAHTFVLPIWCSPVDGEQPHVLTLVLRRVAGQPADRWSEAEAAVFDSDPRFGWYQKQVREQASRVVQRLASELGIDEPGRRKLIASMDRWECFLPEQQDTPCAIHQVVLTQAITFGLSSTQVTPEVVHYAREALWLASLSALDEAVPNPRAVQEWYMSVVVKLLQQTPTQVLPRSCRLTCCCTNTLVHVHPTRPLLQLQASEMLQRRKAQRKPVPPPPPP